MSDMNIYLIQEDGVSHCWQAASMQDAVQLAEDRYIAEVLAEKEQSWHSATPDHMITDLEVQEEREHYRANILQSCAHIAELANP